MFKKLATSIKAFFKEEDGSELMQWAIIVIIVAGLAIAAYALSDSIGEKLGNAKDVLDNLDGPQETT